MILAGEEIDLLFGAKLGMSTMAAAGLGNLVSDVAGLGLADQIEASVRRLSWAQPAPLTLAQRTMMRTRGEPHAYISCGVVFNK